MANVFEPEFDAEQDEPPFSWRRARLGRQAGAEELGASLFELPPGASSFPLAGAAPTGSTTAPTSPPASS